MKIKIIKGKNYDQIARDNRCPSCSGSGRYDSWDTKRNRPIYCGSCGGSGKSEKKL